MRADSVQNSGIEQDQADIAGDVVGGICCKEADEVLVGTERQNFLGELRHRYLLPARCNVVWRWKPSRAVVIVLRALPARYSLTRCGFSISVPTLRCLVP